MYDNALIDKLVDVVGFKNFYDLAQIPDLGTGLTTTESGQYFKDFNPNVRLNFIEPTIDQGRTLEDYLTEVRKEGINTVLNEITTQKQLENVGKAIASEDVVMNVGNNTATLTNESNFVGVSFCVKESTSIRATINRVGLYLTSAVTNLDLYLFHSSQEQVVQKFQFTTNTNNSFSWQEINRALDYDDGLITGGVWYLGYYQSDLGVQGSQAIKYSNMNWLHGYCNTCGGGDYQVRYKSISSRVSMTGFFIQGANLPVSKDERFDIGHLMIDNANNFGFNFHIIVTCNLSQFWYDNRLKLKKVIGLQVCMNILKDMRSGMQINNVQQTLLGSIQVDLMGMKDNGSWVVLPFGIRLSNAIKALILDEGNLHKDCFPCARKPQTKIGAIGA
jgi:hypothetical protein